MIVDIGTDQTSTPVAGEPIEFDFNLLKSDTREPLTTPTSVGIDIGHNGKSMVNCDLITEMPNTFFFYTFPEGGNYTLKVTFFDSKRTPPAARHRIVSAYDFRIRRQNASRLHRRVIRDASSWGFWGAIGGHAGEQLDKHSGSEFLRFWLNSIFIHRSQDSNDVMHTRFSIIFRVFCFSLRDFSTTRTRFCARDADSICSGGIVRSFASADGSANPFQRTRGASRLQHYRARSRWFARRSFQFRGRPRRSQSLPRGPERRRAQALTRFRGKLFRPMTATSRKARMFFRWEMRRPAQPRMPADSRPSTAQAFLKP